MSTERIFDLVVIGAGPAGYIGAIRASQLGMQTACIEKEKTLGGTCLNVGCIPSKALLDSSEHYAFTKTKLSKHGISVADVKLDLSKMMSRKNDVVRQLVTGIAGLFKKHKIERFEGHGEIQKKEGELFVVKVKSSSGEDTLVKAKKILLATGSIPVELPFLPFDGKRIFSSTEAISLESLPEHLIIVGGGYIGLEMASVWSRLGSKVTVIEFAERIVPLMDIQMSGELFKSLKKQGIEFLLSTKCLGADITAGGINVKIEDASQKQSQIAGSHVLVSTGRKPFTKNLGLDNIGLTTDAKSGRILINNHFQTMIPGVYAVGDIVDGPMLAHKAEEEGVAAVECMMGLHGHVNYNAIPAVIYTWPELASVGPSEEELKKKGVAYKVGTFPFLANGRARAMDEAEGLVKVLADAKSNEVLAVHIFGPRASDMIAEATAVLEYGATSDEVAATSHAHPTLSEALKEAALAVDKRQLNF